METIIINNEEHGVGLIHLYVSKGYIPSLSNGSGYSNEMCIDRMLKDMIHWFKTVPINIEFGIQIDEENKTFGLYTKHNN